jgi:hypothetical protein
MQMDIFEIFGRNVFYDVLQLCETPTAENHRSKQPDKTPECVLCLTATSELLRTIAEDKRTGTGPEQRKET